MRKLTGGKGAGIEQEEPRCWGRSQAGRTPLRTEKRLPEEGLLRESRAARVCGRVSLRTRETAEALKTHVRNGTVSGDGSVNEPDCGGNFTTYIN